MDLALELVSHSEEETLAVATKLAAYFRANDVLVLSGPLGSGKTVFVRGLAAALGLDENLVSSPSFTMVNEYPGQLPLYHFDLYRMNSLGELTEIGWDDYLQKHGLVVVEWGERIADLLPSRYYQIEFDVVDDSNRRIRVSARGK